MNIRFANETDASALLAIYGPYIRTSITFETVPPTVAEFAGRIRDISQIYPYIVCEEGGSIVGYAYAHRVRERAAYDWMAELSIYLDPSYTHRGLGAKLYSLLMDLLRLQGMKTVMGCVTVPNPTSVALHEKLGFRHVGTSYSAGYKDGQWHDVAWFEKPLASYDVPPAPLLPFGDVGSESVAAVIARYM